jgi:hypothetical protein
MLARLTQQSGEEPLNSKKIRSALANIKAILAKKDK